MSLLVSASSAVKLRKLMRTAPSNPIMDRHGNEVGRIPLMVRCTSATPAGTGVSAECFPGVVVDLDSTELAADQPEMPEEVWLSLVDGSTPTEDTIYHGLLSGEHSEGSDTRPRVFAAPTGGASSGLSAVEDTLGSTYTISADNTWEDTGMAVTLSDAGTYLMQVTITAEAQYSAGTLGSGFGVRLWSVTEGNSVPATDPAAEVARGGVLNVLAGGTTAFHTLHTSDGGETIRLEAFRSPLVTWTFARLVADAAAGVGSGCRISAIKLF